MWRRLLWWSSERPAALPWAVFISVVLILSGHGVRLQISGAVVRFVYAPFFSLRYRVAAGANVFEENRRLIERVAQLEIENQRLHELAHENVRLRRLIGFAPNWSGSVLPAEVISPLSPMSGTLWITTPSDDSVATNWPVVTEDGLLGRIVEIEHGRSRVRTLWDPLLRVAAYDQRSRVGGIVAWESGAMVQLQHINRSADVMAGDTVLSSGWGGIFPKGLLIGTVAQVDSIPNNDFVRVTVQPAVRSDRLEAAFVIKPTGSDTLLITEDEP